MAKILIVDDSIIMRRNLRTILTQAGHSVIAEASNGKEAFIEYEKHLPDLVTMDITMPIMNGIEAVKKIICRFPDARIIMISALDQRNMVFEALYNKAHYPGQCTCSDKYSAGRGARKRAGRCGGFQLNIYISELTI